MFPRPTKLFILILLAAATLGSDWETHKTKFSLNFSSKSEEIKRKTIWSQNIDSINKHNQQAATDSSITYLKGVNQFTHLTHDKNKSGKRAATTTVMTPSGCSCTCPSSSTTTVTAKQTTTTTGKPSTTTTVKSTTTTTAKSTTTATAKSTTTTVAISTNLTSVDWRNTPLVGPIKDQGQCGLEFMKTGSEASEFYTVVVPSLNNK